MTDEIRTRCKIRENGIPMFSIDICGYLDATRPGDVRWAYHIEGDPSDDAVIAILEKVKLQIVMDNLGLEAAEEYNDDDDDNYIGD